MIGTILAHLFKIVDGSATVGAQLAGATDLPASGSYVDVSDAIRVHILAKLGVVDPSDEPTLTPKCSDSASGTLDVIDTDLAHTVANDDDQEWVSWTIEVEALPTDHHFLAVDVGGTVANGSYAEVFFLLEMQDLPVTQTSTVLPSASQYYYGGGVSQAD